VDAEYCSAMSSEMESHEARRLRNSAGVAKAAGSFSMPVEYGTTNLGSEAFIWDVTNGMRNLRSVLITDYGLDLDGWTLGRAFGISANGESIVGWGINPDSNTEAWIAHVPEPSALTVFSNCGLMVCRKKAKRV